MNSKTEDRSRSKNPENMAKTKLDDAFDLHLSDNRIFINNVDVQPDNKADIISKLAAKRPEPEESDLTTEKFERFQQSNNAALQDDTIMSTVLPILIGTAGTNTANNLLFGNLEHLTDGGLTKPVASCCDGLLLSHIDPQIRKAFSRYIIPSIKTPAICLPNFLMEGASSKNWQIAKRQGGHCGLLAARGVYRLRSYVNLDTALDGNAYTVVAIYTTLGILQLFTIHLARPRSDEIAYYMTLLRSFPLTDDLETFRTGVRALRNARDWAKEQRQTLADAANAQSRAPLPAPSLPPAN